MKACVNCLTPNPAANRFCQQCGRPLEEARPADATVLLTGTQVSKGPTLQTFAVAALFGAKGRVVIGRAPDCDLCLPHPSVSRYHALLERRGDGLWVRDLASVNGVSVSGHRITEESLVRDGDRLGVGPFLLSLTRGVLQSQDNSRSLRLEARELEKVVPVAGGPARKLLDGINLVVHPGEFVSLLGPSGSGKSTLMDCLNGRRRATGGRVLANGEDFYTHFDNFRQSLGYVPQKDIVHAQLTVRRALYYTARLRLPPDTDPAELRARIDAVVREMELGPHADTLVANLSGGQIKRVSLGAELLAQPCLLYIDEATSGLDAGTEARMMRLFRRLADEGRSILCITHNVDNVDQCHLALVLARGRLVYYGPPREATRYFRVARVSDIYDRLSERPLDDWVRDYAGCSLYKEFVLDRLAGAPQEAAPAPPPPEEAPAGVPEKSGPRFLGALLGDGRSRLVALSKLPPLADRFRRLTARYLRLRELVTPARDGWHQFRVLTARYVELVLGDRRGLRLLLLQAPIVAVFLLVGFVGKDFRRPMPIPRELTDDERKMLTALQAVDRKLDEDGTLDAAQKKALRLLRRGGLDPEQEELLAKARFTVDHGGKEVEVSGAELLRASRRFRESRIAEKLLAVQGPVVPEREWVNPRFTYVMLFIVVVIVLWFGCNNAAKEIVKEEAIYGRERAVNLRILPYLASKFFVLTAITAFHALVLMVMLFGTLEALHSIDPRHSTPPPELMAGYATQYGVMVLLSMTGVALGLLLSACVSTPDRANALLPYVLIPQMILGGGILAVNEGALKYLAMALSPAYWAYRAVHTGAWNLPKGFPGYASHPDGVALPAQALLIQTAVLLLLTAWFLRRKDAK